MEADSDRIANASTSAVKAAPEIQIVDLTEGEDSASVQDNEDESDDSEGAWETESFYEDLVEQGLDDSEDAIVDPQFCTPEEALSYRRLLRAVGVDQFIIRTIEQGTTAKRLCSAFFKPPTVLFEGQPDEAWYPLLGKLMERELVSRQKLSKYNTVEDAVALLKDAKNVVVITGAGISTSLGIPDFRSKHTGFYAQLAPLGLNDPQEVFDLHLFQQDPTIFYSIAKGILPSTKKFSPTHAFIRLLQDQDKLLTNYTQNIDNLEEAAGIDQEKLVQCHGSFATATCQECGYNCRGEEIFDDLKAGRVARCKACAQHLRQIPPAGMKRKRSSNGLSSKKKRADYEDSTDDEDEYTIQEPGIMKPDITFFGEALSQRFHDRFKRQDRAHVDLVIVLGTKLTVAPVGDIPGSFPPHVPQIFVSREPCGHINFDIELLGDCDVVVEELCKRAGWDLQHEMIPPEQTISVDQVEESMHRWTFTTNADGSASMSNPTAGNASLGAVEHGRVDRSDHEDVEDEIKDTALPSRNRNEDTVCGGGGGNGV